MHNPNSPQGQHEDHNPGQNIVQPLENDADHQTEAGASSAEEVRIDVSERVSPRSQSRRQKRQAAGEGRGDSIAGTVIVCMFVLILIMGYFLHKRLTALETNTMSAADSILIIDYRTLFASLPEDITGEAAEQIFNDVHARIMALQDAGYIVLDADSVLAAPPEMRIDGSLLINGEL